MPSLTAVTRGSSEVVVRRATRSEKKRSGVMTRVVVVRGFRLPGMLMVALSGGEVAFLMMEGGDVALLLSLGCLMMMPRLRKARLRNDGEKPCVEMMVGRVTGENGVGVWALARGGDRWRMTVLLSCSPSLQEIMWRA